MSFSFCQRPLEACTAAFSSSSCVARALASFVCAFNSEVHTSLSAYVYETACKGTHTHTHTHIIFMFIYTFIHIFISTSTYVYIYIYICVHICIYKYIYIYAHTYMYIYMYTCVYVFVCVCVSVVYTHRRSTYSTSNACTLLPIAEIRIFMCVYAHIRKYVFVCVCVWCLECVCCVHVPENRTPPL